MRKRLFIFTLILAAVSLWLNPGVFARRKDRRFFDRVVVPRDEAFKRVFGDAPITADTRTLTSEMKNVIRGRGYRHPLFTDTYVIYSARHEGEDKPFRFAMILNQPGQHRYITFMVAITPEGAVYSEEILVYREPQGGEVEDKRFLAQFKGKTSSSPLRVKSDITHITGATISSKALAAGTKRALLVWEAFQKE